MRHLFSLGLALAVATGCGGDSFSGSGKDPSRSHDGGASDAGASGGAGGATSSGGAKNAGGQGQGGTGGKTGSGGTAASGGAPGTQCRTTADCPQLGCYMCPATVCTNGVCTAQGTLGSGGATSTGGAPGAGGAAAGGGTASGGAAGSLCGGAVCGPDQSCCGPADCGRCVPKNSGAFCPEFCSSCDEMHCGEGTVCICGGPGAISRCICAPACKTDAECEARDPSLICCGTGCTDACTCMCD